MKPIKKSFKRWKYIYDKNAPNFYKSLIVESPDNRPKPEFLFKYYSLTPFNIDALQNKYLYASHKDEINDDFDCLRELIDMRNVPDQDIYSYFLNYHSEEKIKNDFVQYKHQFALAKSINYQSGYGIVSMTENILSPLMWAHYSSLNQGFAVKFNLKYFPDDLCGPFPINYQKYWDSIKYNINYEPLAILFMTNIKSSVWEYEKEWRFLGIKFNQPMSIPRFQTDTKFVDNRKFPYNIKAIEEIILGHRFINDLNKSGDPKTKILAFTPDVKCGNEKVSLLHFIIENNIKTSRIVLKKGSNSFELDTEPVLTKKIDNYSFQMTLNTNHNEF